MDQDSDKKEKNRLDDLYSYSILDTSPEKDFDDIVLLASEICNTPIAFISLVDEKRQWFKASKGLVATETTRDLAVCSYAIETPKQLTIIEDVREHDKYSNHPFIYDKSIQMLFYASAPLVNSKGNALGTICVLDKKPRTITAKQQLALKALSRQVINAFELRKKQNILEDNNIIIKYKNDTLNNFIHNTIDNISSPLNTISMTNDIIAKHIKNNNIDALKKYFNMISHSNSEMIDLIDDLKKRHHHIDMISAEKEKFDMIELIHNVINEERVKNRGTISFNSQKDIIFQNKQVFKKVIALLIRCSMTVNINKEVSLIFTNKINKDNILVQIQDNSLFKIEPNHSSCNTLNDAVSLIKAVKWEIDIHYNERGNLISLTIPANKK